MTSKARMCPMLQTSPTCSLTLWSKASGCPSLSCQIKLISVLIFLLLTTQHTHKEQHDCFCNAGCTNASMSTPRPWRETQLPCNAKSFVSSIRSSNSCSLMWLKNFKDALDYLKLLEISVGPIQAKLLRILAGLIPFMLPCPKLAQQTHSPSLPSTPPQPQPKPMVRNQAPSLMPARSFNTWKIS